MPPTHGSDQIQELYDLAKSSAQARRELDESARLGLVQRYHRTLRERPEAGITDALAATRHQINDLVRERRRVATAVDMPETRQSMELSQLDQAIAQVAAGTVLWAKEWMGGVRE